MFTHNVPLSPYSEIMFTWVLAETWC